ncbi:hypothetical protein [Agriterribacter sp.]|uniref:hypothetical protein n=1 Tax=Agriterribacter sp. TaxID=2821509 RepID=UPI002B7CEAE0|nr:hypothetical protein [Agriterribacter sp.]HRP55435.1 hypothetical protein [Agriterribacter sp.]
MAESFILTVPGLQEEQVFEAQLQVYGYSHRIVVHIENEAIGFEPDEEGNYRAVLLEEGKRLNIDKALLQAIAIQLEKDLKQQGH